MAMIISNSELLELSIKIEREGEKFYKELADHVKDSIVKDFLIHMAKEEASHENQFKKILEETDNFGWENDENLKVLTEEKFQTDIFPKIGDTLGKLSQFEDIEKAFDFAIESEKVSAEFYHILGSACKDIELKTKLLQLEKAELDHCDKVEYLKKRIQGKFN
jgi:rubrerythrin